jgi:hypothetical protein
MASRISIPPRRGSVHPGRAGGLFGVAYEVRSGAKLNSKGFLTHKGVLKGVFNKGSTAREYAEALEDVGAKGVLVIPIDANKSQARHAAELARAVRERFHHRPGYSMGRRTNRAGLTWVEWVHRAGLDEHTVRDRHRLAWVAAEDPAEWREGAPRRAPHVHHARAGHSMGKTVKKWKKQAHAHAKSMSAAAKAKAEKAFASASAALKAEAKKTYASANKKAKAAYAKARAKVRDKIVQDACDICDAGKGKRIRGAR